MAYSKLIDYLKRFWEFVWHDDSIASWVVSVILAFLIVKFLIYPGLGLAFGTTHPIVAVVSGSMEHKAIYDSGKYAICGNMLDEKRNIDIDTFWELCGSFYDGINTSKEQFKEFKFSNGFNTGDVMFIFGTKPKDIKIGDVIVFKTQRPDPIIHRVIGIESNGEITFKTKGDHNSNVGPDEKNIGEDRLVGRAVLRVPFLGYVKIVFVKLLGMVKGG